MMADKDMTPSDDVFLDDFFAAARLRPEPVPQALTDRVLRDAAALQPRLAAPAPRAGRGWLATLAAALFGAGSMAGPLAGISVALVAGVWMGFVQPVGLGMAGDVDADLIETIELLPNSLDAWAQELGMDILVEDEQ